MSTIRGPPANRGFPHVEQRPCECSETDTPHEITLRIITESPGEKFSQHSREPYRIATCQYCGIESRQRMNRQ